MGTISRQGLPARLVLAALLAGLACGVAAQKVYRSVGPDGKVVFSDQPPTDRDAAVIRNGIAAPAVAPAAADSAWPAGDPGAPRGSKRALRAGAADAAVTAAGREQARAVAGIASSLQALTGRDDLVRNFEEVCANAQPAQAAGYHRAADKWRERHALLLARRDIILGDTLSQQQRSELDAAARSDTRQVMDPIYAAPLERRVKWCDQSADEILSGKLDRHQDPRVAGPIMAYQPRR